jgi:Arc/MetJ-type ribon-helix-helix transcriptional regulator
MNAVRGRVRGGRIELDGALPEGAEVVVLASSQDESFSLDEARLALIESRMAEADRGDVEPASTARPEDLQAFAEERVRTGQSTSVAEVVRDALEEKKRRVLREALDAGITELDAGLGVKGSPEELMAEISVEARLPP